MWSQIQASRNFALIPTIEMERLPQSIILFIFSYLPYKYVRKTVSLVCKTWFHLACDRSLVRYAREEDFLEVKARDKSSETVESFLEIVEWRPNLFHSIDLSGSKTTWEEFAKIVRNCGGLVVLNMAKMEGEVSDYPLIRAGNIVELNLSQTTIDDCFLVNISENLPKLGILNVSSCENLTANGIKRASFPSLRFLGIANGKVGVESIIYCISHHEIFAMCVEGTLSKDEIAHLVDVFPDVSELGIPSLCGLPQGVVSPEALSPLCFYCRSSSSATVLTVKQCMDGSWMEL